MELVPCLRGGSQFGDFCFSHDSKYLFCCCGSLIKVNNTSNGECVRDLKGHSLKVTGVKLNPSNVLQIISCGQDGLLLYWDYLDGVKLKTFNLHVPLFGIVSINADKKSMMMVAQTSEHNKTFSVMQWKKLKPSYNEFDKPKMLIQECKDDCRLISFGCSRDIVASGSGYKLSVYSMTKESKIVIKDKDKFNYRKAITCVACHPTEYIIACGYENGKIILWHNILQANRASSIQHWHTLPVLCLDFSTDGSILLSGGHECVLVRWQMNNTHQKDFKPRMGAPITHILSSPDGSLYATRHSNNVLQLLNINFKILQVYRGLTRSNLGLHTDRRPIPSGLHFDPRSQALVMNGLPGHLQFYSLALHKQLFNLDIVGQNYISPENLDQPKVITEILSTAISADGVWLATFESWDDGYFTPENRLKMWNWSTEAQTYCLNTTVECPHDGCITSMKFRPVVLPAENAKLMLVTLGADKFFKLWTLIDDSDIYRSNTRWNCESVGFYRGLNSLCVDFSDDASVLAVGFEHLLTLWDPDRNIVKTTLTNSTSQKESLKTLKFGSLSCKHHLVATTESNLLVWDLLTLSIVWSMPQDKVILFKDPSSDLMAFVTDSQKLCVFRPNSSSVVYEHQRVCSSSVVDAIFVPQGRSPELSGKGWPGTSQIYLFTSDEELITFTAPGMEDQNQSVVRIAQNLPTTALSTLMAEKLVRESDKRDLQELATNTTTSADQDSFLEMVLHSKEPVSLHCSQYLQNLLSKRKSVKKGLASSADSESDESSESDMEVDDSPSKRPKSSGNDRDSDVQSVKEERIPGKLLSQPPPADWVQWCASLKLK